MQKLFSRFIGLAVPITVLSVMANAAPATAAPKRTFVCEQGDLVVTVLSERSIRVSVKMPDTADGNFTMTMARKGKQFRYVKGEYEVKITAEQNSLVYSAPDFGSTNCNWEGF